MAKFTYNNTKNASIGHISFEFNYEYHLCVLFKEDVDPRSRSMSARELSSVL